jgi:hypothetical protein
MGGLDISCGDSDRCPGPGRPLCRMIQFGQTEQTNRSSAGYSGQVPIAAGFSVPGRHRHFCRSSGGIVLVRHPGVCAVC